MCSVWSDYSIFHRFSFQYKPVGIKFLLNRLEGIEKLDASIAFCEMFRKAQDRKPFYAAKENFACMERLLLGMMEPEPIFESGQIGEKEKIYQEARANRRIYQYLPKLAKNTVRYVAFSPIDKLTFEPDVLVITADPRQAEILLRALSYSTGKPLTTKITPVLMCAWLFFYPYVTGELNYTITVIYVKRAVKSRTRIQRSWHNTSDQKLETDQIDNIFSKVCLISPIIIPVLIEFPKR